MGAKIRLPKPEERGPRTAILLLGADMLSTAKDETIILLPFPISNDVFNKIRQHITNIHQLPNPQTSADVLEGIALRLQSNITKTANCQTSFPSNSMGIIFENVSFTTVPELIPVLMVRLSTCQETA